MFTLSEKIKLKKPAWSDKDSGTVLMIIKYFTKKALICYSDHNIPFIPNVDVQKKDHVPFLVIKTIVFL